jgi:hypothetical protein
MPTQKKSFVSTLKTAKKVNVASAQKSSAKVAKVNSMRSLGIKHQQGANHNQTLL